MKKPTFSDDDEAAKFWESHEPLDYITETERVQTPRPPRAQAISLRLDPTILGLARRIARRKGIGYQTLIKMWITEAVSREIDRGGLQPMDRVILVENRFGTFSDTARDFLPAPKLIAPVSRETSSAEGMDL